MLNAGVFAEHDGQLFLGQWYRDPKRVKCGKCRTGVVLLINGERTRLKTRCAVCNARVIVEYGPAPPPFRSWRWWY
jgi:hypothetical protein